ncbi:MAG: hypothetical protein ACXWT0_00040 [Methylobacter sp.]
MARTHMVNQKGSASNEFGIWMIVALIFSIGVVSMITQAARASDPVQCSVLGGDRR